MTTKAGRTSDDARAGAGDRPAAPTDPGHAQRQPERRPERPGLAPDDARTRQEQGGAESDPDHPAR